jgi:DNA helicase II / ATP-dependent DNA helicase PcrA
VGFLQWGMFSPLAPVATSAHTTLSPLLDSLNPEQRAAVTLPAAHALILAGAGSGKTRVLTTRIAWLLQNGYVSSGGILAVTFTNKAAKEMMTRLSSMLPVNVHGMWIGTFHGLCNRFLRTHFKMANLPQSFQILDTQDQLSAIKRVYKQFNMDDERFPAKQMQWFISGSKEEGLRPAAVEVRDEETRKKVEIYQLYEAQCQRDGVVDFGELMLRSYEVLRDNDAIREHYQRRFRHILIDEFQDTNKLQYAWIKMLAGTGAAGSVLAVGDDDQSIYAFRGARVGNMADFVREFNVQHQIKLEQNYRSYSNILDSANALISHNSKRLGKSLRTDQGAGEPVRVYEAPSDFVEAQWMVDEMRSLLTTSTDWLPPSASGPLGGSELHAVSSVGAYFQRKEIAVLYRSNAQSRVIETALFNAGMPYKVYGGLRFFDRAEIKNALAYLRLLENPRDDTSFLRVVNFPPRGIGARSLEQLQDVARAAGCCLSDAVSGLGGKAGSNIGAFLARIDVLREQTEGLTLREITELMLKHSGLIEHYHADREGADRVENLEELVNAAESFVSLEGFGRDAVALPESGLTQSPASQGLDITQGLDMNQAMDTQPAPDFEAGETLSPLAAFLSHAALEAGDNQAQAGQDAVQLMTVHSSKGLEFDCVFITGMEEGLFPHENSMNDRDGLEEERRLMYVAITRARKRLYLSHSQTRMLHGQTRYNLKSRFFEELPEECLKWLTPKQRPMDTSWGGGRSIISGAGRAWGQGYAPGSAASGAYQVASISGSEAPRKTEAAYGLKLGQKVFHTKFGEGTVLTLEGMGDDTRAQIDFPRHGIKWLALSVAKLTPVP